MKKRVPAENHNRKRPVKQSSLLWQFSAPKSESSHLPPNCPIAWTTAFVAQQRQHIHTKQKPHDWHVLRPSQQNQVTHNLHSKNSPKNWSKQQRQNKPYWIIINKHRQLDSPSQRHLSNRPICSCSSSARRLKQSVQKQNKTSKTETMFQQNKASQKK